MNKKLSYTVPLVVLLVALVLVIASLLPKTTREAFDFDRFASLPVLDGGRFKPIDSMARTDLLILREKQYVENAQGEKVSAREWLGRLMLAPHSVDEYPVFRIDHGDIQALLGVREHSRKYFSYAELQPLLQHIETQARLVNEDAKKRDAFQKAIVELHTHLILYQGLMTSVRPHAHGQTVMERYDAYMKNLKFNATRFPEGQTPDMSDPSLIELMNFTQEFSQLSSNRSIGFIPLPNGGKEWLNLSEGLFAPLQVGQLPGIVLVYAELADAFSAGDFEKANAKITELEKLYQSATSSYSPSKIGIEYRFNQIQPFVLCIELYVLLFLAVVVGWATVSSRTLQAGFWILILAFIIHSVAMIVRMWLMGRPPATNLYSSAITVGWITPLLGIILEWIYRNGIGSMIAAVTGFLSLIVAQHLMAMGDTMEMMRAVLDSNFWLTVHVITVIIGYASTFVAGFIAVAYIILGIFTKRLTKELSQSMNRMVYGIVCFALLFSFFGTFSGGIWADQSWGRFWGWDPKENGALMIVIWNALILHARRGGAVREHGMMMLAVAGNMITAWSWFGTNMLGVGLHSYGFMDSALFWLFTFWASQIAIILMAYLIPRESWRSTPGKLPKSKASKAQF